MIHREYGVSNVGSHTKKDTHTQMSVPTKYLITHSPRGIFYHSKQTLHWYPATNTMESPFNDIAIALATAKEFRRGLRGKRHLKKKMTSKHIQNER